MKLGTLEFTDVTAHFDLVGEPVKVGITTNLLQDILVSEIDPGFSDTAAFCEHYDISLDMSVNCVIVEAKRADQVWYAALMIPATVRADINGIVRRHLDARKISFAPMETATALSHMEYGGICPIGLPQDWAILVDTRAASLEHALIGSGVRGSKLVVSGNLLASLPNATVLNLVRE